MVIVVSARSVQSCAGLSRKGLIGYLLALRLGPWFLAKARRIATCSAGPVGQTVAFLHQIEAALARCAWQSLQNTPETRQEEWHMRRAGYRRGYVSFNFEEKKMKNILLATTAIALTAGYAAADVSIQNGASANDIGITIWLANFGTAAVSYGLVGTDANSSLQVEWLCMNEFDISDKVDDVDVNTLGSGEAGGVAYSRDCQHDN